MRIKLSTFLALPVAALAIACSAAPGNEPTDPAPVGTTTAPTASDLEPTVTAFAQAVSERNEAAFEATLSDEVRAQMRAKGYDTPAFLAKQRAAILSTLGLADSDHISLDVVSVESEGDGLRVILASQGKELTKPLYFVKEDGTYKLNFGAPGFSKAPPVGALYGKDNYTVHNVNIYGNGPVNLQCYQGGSGAASYKNFIVQASQTIKVACENSCGWFSGSTFARVGGGSAVIKKCDWNWWGDDVIISLFDYGGFHCNDGC